MARNRPLTKSDLQFMDFAIYRFLMKLFTAILMTLSRFHSHSYYKPFKCDFYPRDAILTR